MSSIIWPHIVDGVAVGEMRRIIGADGSKIDIPYYTDGDNGFTKGVPESKKPLPVFGLDSIEDYDRDILVVEGQKVQFVIQSLGFQVITSVLGATNAGSTDWKPARGGKRYIYIPDNDTVGERYVSDVCGFLQPSDGDHFVARFAELEKKDDLIDWLKLQPELSDWDGISTLANHRARKVIADRLKNELASRIKPVPEAWLCLWPEPEAIEQRLRPVEQFPLELIPLELREWIQDAAYRKRVPIDYIAVAVVTALSAAIGSRCAIRPYANDDWAVIPNLWGAIIGPPGIGKTPALQEACFALESMEMEAGELAAGQMRSHQAKLASYDARKAAIETQMKDAAKQRQNAKDMNVLEEELAALQPPEAPSAMRFIATDTTLEALIKLLKDNPRGLLMLHDELATLLTSWEKQGHESDRAFFLQCWSGNGKHRKDTVKDGTIVVDRLCLSVLGGIQEDLLRSFLTKTADNQNDGMIQRFQLMVYPDPPTGSFDIVDVAPNKEAKLRAMSIFTDLVKAPLEHFGAQTAENGRPFFRFDPDAQALFYDWQIDLRKRISESEQPLLKEHLNKYDKLMPALALIFHLVRCSVDGAYGPVTKESALLAAQWCGYLEDHAARVYDLLKTREQCAASVLAEKIKLGAITDENGQPRTRFTARQVRNKQWRLLKTTESVNTAATELEEAGWLRRSILQTGGHPLKEYIINPKLCSGYKVRVVH